MGGVASHPEQNCFDRLGIPGLFRGGAGGGGCSPRSVSVLLEPSWVIGWGISARALEGVVGCVAPVAYSSSSLLLSSLELRDTHIFEH